MSAEYMLAAMGDASVFGHGGLMSSAPLLPFSPPVGVEAEVVASLASALGTSWGPDEPPRVLEPADAQSLAAYHARLLTTMAVCIRDLAAEVDRLRAAGGHSRGTRAQPE